MPPVVAAAAAFTAWGATSLTAAVVVGAVKGAVIGALIGGASAAVTGGDILKGALKGAAIGGVTGGLVGGFSYAPAAGATSSTMATGTAEIPAELSGGGNVATNVPVQAQSVPQLQQASQAADIASASQAKIYAGIGEGAMQGVGQVGASMIESRSKEKELKAAMELQELGYAQDADKIAANVPGQFSAQVANAEITDWWNKHLLADNPLTSGLLTPNVQRGLI